MSEKKKAIEELWMSVAQDFEGLKIINVEATHKESSSSLKPEGVYINGVRSMDAEDAVHSANSKMS